MIFSLVHHYPPIQKWWIHYIFPLIHHLPMVSHEFSHEFSLQTLVERTLTEYQLRSEAVDMGMESDFFLGGTMKNDDLSDLTICFSMGISAYHGK